MKIFRGCVQAVRQLEGVSELLAVTLASKTCSGPKQGCSVGFYVQLETVSVRLKHGFVQIVRRNNEATFFQDAVYRAKA
jgi:hypothetical protein